MKENIFLISRMKGYIGKMQSLIYTVGQRFKRAEADGEVKQSSLFQKEYIFGISSYFWRTLFCNVFLSRFVLFSSSSFLCVQG